MRVRVWVAVWLWGLAGPGALAQERTVEESLDFAVGSLLTLESARGSLQLTGGDEERLELRARIVAPDGVDAEAGRQAVEAIRIEVRGNRRSMRVRTRYDDLPRGDDGDRVVPLVHYEISVPAAIDLDISLDRSDTTLDRLDGRLMLALDRSDLEARRLSGQVTLDLDRGAVRLTEVTGSLVASVDRSELMLVEGLRGSVALSLDRTTARLSGVAIEDDASVRIDRGELDVGLVPDQALDVSAEASRRAGVSSQLPGTEEEDGEVRASLNGGGARLRVDADRAQVRLRLE